jgi:hypothetical protein
MTARDLAEQALEHAGKAPPFFPGSNLSREANDFYVFARTALPALAGRVLALEEALRSIRNKAERGQLEDRERDALVDIARTAYAAEERA